eukprot:TRINITY_DN113304_c0_g1_i2.p1 TRINITY_DN113304_c0_g1~~TRINITY_DN113304_c0_g1_i2.p1  ORF type:complete len:165 (+),score=31.42 TRINITY_DN113304_c0_g1_i2:53-547(+)
MQPSSAYPANAANGGKTRRVLCVAFQEGRCPFADRCRFTHATAKGSNKGGSLSAGREQASRPKAASSGMVSDTPSSDSRQGQRSSAIAVEGSGVDSPSPVGLDQTSQSSNAGDASGEMSSTIRRPKKPFAVGLLSPEASTSQEDDPSQQESSDDRSEKLRQANV